jgi:membrane-associated phospholipid phosphatase
MDARQLWNSHPVFPSAHVAGALATAFSMRLALPGRKWVYRTLFVMTGLIAVATVYGRYHYLADATYGAVIATLVAGVLALDLQRPPYVGTSLRSAESIKPVLAGKTSTPDHLWASSFESRDR